MILTLIDCEYHEVSAKTGNNVNQMFLKGVKNALGLVQSAQKKKKMQELELEEKKKKEKRNLSLMNGLDITGFITFLLFFVVFILFLTFHPF